LHNSNAGLALSKETNMLILTRRVGETLMIGDQVSVTVLGVKGNQVRIGVKLPKKYQCIVKKFINAFNMNALCTSTFKTLTKIINHHFMMMNLIKINLTANYR